ncbi:helix-turn-helix domain-containing protein [Longispora sp. K20-0274]|uniref:GlxA family transcriptional regulator n=1 Tax=Longispora sp. K20-0274 TaxID=3088255 RepID=UPI003999EDA1
MRTVAAYAPPGTISFGLSLVAEVFQPRAGGPDFAFELCTDVPGPVAVDPGLTVTVGHGLDRLAAADLVLALPGLGYADWSPASVAAFRAAADRGALVAGHCVGAFLLATAGLLDGRRATTHWRFADRLAERFPAVDVRPDLLYVDEGRVLTGAGAAAGLDMCLHLIRREHGAAVAAAIARELVVPPHRDGGQAQYAAVAMPAAGADPLAEVLDWAVGQLHRPLSVDELARRALLSRRTFIRRFRAATGVAPGAWLIGQRLRRAEELLETTDLPMEEVARRVGYASAAALRDQFTRRRGVPPSRYRHSFGQAPGQPPR